MIKVFLYIEDFLNNLQNHILFYFLIYLMHYNKLRLVNHLLIKLDKKYPKILVLIQKQLKIYWLELSDFYHLNEKDNLQLLKMHLFLILDYFYHSFFSK